MEEMERLVVVWCPELQQEGARGEEARRFVQVVARAGELCPWVHPIRLGVCAPAARARPARFFGGEEMVVSRLVEAVDEEAAVVGVADGLFRSHAGRPCRADRPGGGGGRAPGSLVGRHSWPGLSWPSPCSGWGSPPWVSSPPCRTLTSLTVSGADAAACHRVARGVSGELVGLRDKTITRRLRVARGEDPDGGVEPPPYQPGFFGGTSAADTRAALSFCAPGCRSGWESTRSWSGGWHGGRDPADQSALVPWAQPARPICRAGWRTMAGAAAATVPNCGVTSPPSGRSGGRRRDGVCGERAGDARRGAGTGCRSTADHGSP